MPDCGAPGAESRGFRSPDLFLPLVLASVPEYRVEHFVAADARGTGQPWEIGQYRFE
jgi:hypothetical protein